MALGLGMFGAPEGGGNANIAGIPGGGGGDIRQLLQYLAQMRGQPPGALGAGDPNGGLGVALPPQGLQSGPGGSPPMNVLQTKPAIQPSMAAGDMDRPASLTGRTPADVPGASDALGTAATPTLDAVAPGGLTSDAVTSWLQASPQGMPAWATSQGLTPERYAAWVARNPQSIGAQQAMRFAQGTPAPAPAPAAPANTLQTRPAFRAPGGKPAPDGRSGPELQVREPARPSPGTAPPAQSAGAPPAATLQDLLGRALRGGGGGGARRPLRQPAAY